MLSCMLISMGVSIPQHCTLVTRVERLAFCGSYSIYLGALEFYLAC